MLTDYIDLKTANVYGIYGHLGGGKTLTAVEIMLYMLKLGFSVTSNVRIFNYPNTGKYTFVEDFRSVDFWKLPCGAPRGTDDPFRSVIVIDECAEFFDQYSSTSPQLKSFMSWLRHSSKRGQFVFAIVQKPEYIAKSLRLLINKWIMCDDMAQFRLPVIRMRIPGMGGFVRRLIYDRYGNVISRGMNLADKVQIGYYYDTAQSIALAGRESDYQSVKRPRPLPYGRTLLIISLIYIWLLFHYT